jgi:predicted amidophosphoribosyltransferase
MNAHHFSIFRRFSKQISESQNEFETKKKIVNGSIRICIECGSGSVKIENFGIYCKECKKKFKIEKDL